MIAASLRATATQARWWPRFLAIFSPHAFRLLKPRNRVSMMLAAS